MTEEQKELLKIRPDGSQAKSGYAQSEQSARENEQRLLLAIEASRVGICDWNAVTNVVFYSARWKEMLGYQEDEISNTLEEWDSRVHPDDKEQCYANLQSHFDGIAPIYESEHRMLCKDGSYRWILERGKVISWTKENTPLRVVGTHTDITARKHAEDALKKSESRHRLIARATSDAIWDFDVATRSLVWNDGLQLLFGFEPDASYDFNWWSEKVHPDDRDRVLRARNAIIESDASDCSIEYRFRRHSGDYATVVDRGYVVRDESGKAIRMAGAMNDITERKRMETELLRIQKLESIGILAGGIAHDFNNLMTIISGNLGLAQLALRSGEACSTELTRATLACDRARDLTNRLLTFSKGGKPIRKAVSAGPLLRETVDFALSGANVACECHMSISDNIKLLHADKGQISQVIQNLIINAEQAMPEGGVIRLVAENALLQNDDVLPLDAGAYLKILISDHGVGIGKGNLEKIFDPFFTTKQKGSGLGLSVVHSIVHNHEGYISCDSTLDIGTTFTLYLPASAEDESRDDTGKTASATAGGRILVMDDEEFIREYAADLLERFGHRVEAARGGQQAVDMYKDAIDAGDPFDTVILDLTVPGGMGGKKAIEELSKIDPQVKAIICSGYANDPVMADYRDFGFRGVVNKPFNIEELAEAVSKVIQAKA